MKIKLERFAWFGNRPIVTEFEGTQEEFDMLREIGFVDGVKKNLIKTLAKENMVFLF